MNLIKQVDIKKYIEKARLMNWKIISSYIVVSAIACFLISYVYMQNKAQSTLESILSTQENTILEYRIDIKNTGSSTNDIQVIEYTGNTLKPTWFADSTGIGSVFLGNLETTSITLQAINDGNLIIQFKGQDRKIKGVRYPEWIDYTSIIIDGDEILSEQVETWHDKPYVFEVPVKDNQIISIETQQVNDGYSEAELNELASMFNSPDMDRVIERFITLWLISLALLGVVILIKYKINTDYKPIDFVGYLTEKYNEIDIIERRAFWAIFIFGNILYSFQAYNDLVGYHSYYLVKNNIYDMTYIGRFFTHYSSYLSYSTVLPLFHNALCMLPLSLGAVFMAKLWQMPKTLLAYTLLGAFLVATPHTISWIYYSGSGNYFPFLFIPAALLLLQKRGVVRFLLASFFLYFAFGIYQPAVNTLAVTYIGMCIIGLLDDISLKKIKDYVYIACGCVSGFILYVIHFLYYKSVGVINTNTDNYMTNTESPLSALMKIPTLFIDSLNYFIIPQPYFENDYKITAIVICALAIFALFLAAIKQIQTKQKVITCLLLVITIPFLILATNLSSLVSVSNMANEPRIVLYGYVVLVMFAIACIIKAHSKIFSCIGMIAILFIVYVSTTNTLLFQKNWKLASDIELNRIERVIARIEEKPNYSLNEPYRLYFVGFPNNPFETLYAGDSANKTAMPYSASLVTTFALHHVFTYLEPEMKFIRSFYPNFPEEQSIETQEKVKKGLKTALPWPHPSSVQVIDNVILVVWNEEALLAEREKVGIK